MKKLGLILCATAFICSSGFLKKGEDGSYSIDKADLKKQASDIAAQATAEAEKYTGKTKAEMMDMLKKAAEKYNVSEEEVMADLGKSATELKAKVANMDKAKLVAYLSKYKEVFTGTEGKVAEYTEQVKNLKWYQKYGAKGKELKTSLTKYNDQFKDLKTKASVYVDKLEAYGINLSDYGVDLSKYGL